MKIMSLVIRVKTSENVSLRTAPSEGSGLSAHLRGLIRTFTRRIFNSQ